MNEHSLYLRKADCSDVEMIFRWANDPETRSNSFNQEMIKHDEHCRWFDSILKSNKEELFVVMDGKHSVGQVRLSIIGDCAEISYSVAPEKRGMGYGKRIISLVKEKVHEDYCGIKKVIAKVKPTNTASIKCFEQNEFQELYKYYEFDMRKYVCAR